MATLGVHLWEPRSPGEMIVWTWAMCPKGAPEDFRRESYRTTMGTFSAGGTFEADDTDPWISIARSADTAYGRKVGMKIDYRMGMSGSADSKRVDDYPIPESPSGTCWRRVRFGASIGAGFSSCGQPTTRPR